MKDIVLEGCRNFSLVKEHFYGENVKLYWNFANGTSAKTPAGSNFIMLLGRKYCLANFFANRQNEWGTSWNNVNFMEFWLITRF